MEKRVKQFQIPLFLLTTKARGPCTLTAFSQKHWNPGRSEPQNTFCPNLLWIISIGLEEKSVNTIEKYLRDVCVFAGFLAGQEVTKEIVISYKQKLVDDG